MVSLGHNEFKDTAKKRNPIDNFNKLIKLINSKISIRKPKMIKPSIQKWKNDSIAPKKNLFFPPIKLSFTPELCTDYWFWLSVEVFNGQKDINWFAYFAIVQYICITNIIPHDLKYSSQVYTQSKILRSYLAFSATPNQDFFCTLLLVQQPTRIFFF